MNDYQPISTTVEENSGFLSSTVSCKIVALPTWKRLTDVCLSVAALPAFLIVGAFVWATMRLSGDNGPILFRQERVGFRGQLFTCLKFRTMKVNADTEAHKAHVVEAMRLGKPLTKMDNKRDTRLIAGAWILRAVGLDELPQILNVIKGEMSLVGPRPCVPYEAKEYLPWQLERLNATPGLTGLWQVSGKNRTTFEEMIRLDVRYTQKKSFWLDLQIILMTIPAMVVQFSDTKRNRKKT